MAMLQTRGSVRNEQGAWGMEPGFALGYEGWFGLRHSLLLTGKGRCSLFELFCLADKQIGVGQATQGWRQQPHSWLRTVG